jgi:hypothetical protein
MIIVFLVFVYFLYLKTNIALNIDQRKMGRRCKQIGKCGNLGGENGERSERVGE